MTRRIVWITVLVLACLVLGTAWFLTNYEQVPVTTREAPLREARLNRYLALERFMARMGRPLTQSSDARLLDHPPPGGVLILDRNRRTLMSEERVQHLFDWVARGGYLIVAPEFGRTPDPIMEKIGVAWFPPPEPTQSKKPDPNKASDTCDVVGARLVSIPGERSLSIDIHYPGLQAKGRSPQWVGAQSLTRQQNLGFTVMHFAHGHGNITVIANLDYIMNNNFIGNDDNAELLWTLVHHYQPGGAVMLISQIAVPGLFDWLAEYAWAVLISAAALLVLWLWRVVPRFGVIAPDPLPQRRELREHLAAIGRFVWRDDGLDHWLEVLRAAFRVRLTALDPALGQLHAAQLADALAKRTAYPRAALFDALAGPVTRPAEFTRSARLLLKLENNLRNG